MALLPSPQGDVCPAGHYCPPGTHEPFPCPPGTFNRKAGAGNASGCDPCTGGMYCDQYGLDEPVAACAAGYYCPAGTAEEHTHPCPVGYHCPAGVAAPVLCDPGWYQDTAGQADCRLCPPGSYCAPDDRCNGTNYTQPRPCPAGYCSGCHFDRNAVYGGGGGQG